MLLETPRHGSSHRLISLLLIGSIVTALAVAVRSTAAAVPSPDLQDQGSVPASNLASCFGQNSTPQYLTFNTPVESDIAISCAPLGAKVTSVQVHVEFGRGCPAQLNVRLDNSTHPIKSKFLQTGVCPAEILHSGFHRAYCIRRRCCQRYLEALPSGRV